MIKTAIAVLALAIASFGQAAHTGRTTDNGPTLPLTCQTNQIFKLTAVDGANAMGLYSCDAVDTWTGPVGASGGGGGNANYTGTQNVIPKGSAAAHTLGDSSITDNGTTVKLTESVTPTVAAANNLGTALLPFGDIFIGGSASHSLDFDVSGLSTNRTVVWPNAAGTVTLGGNTFNGTGNILRTVSAALTTPDLGTPSAIALTNATSFPAAIVQTGQANTYGAFDQNFVTASTMELPSTRAGASTTSTSDVAGQDFTGGGSVTGGTKTYRGCDVTDAGGATGERACNLIIRGGDNAQVSSAGIQTGGSLTIRPGATTDGAGGGDTIPGYMDLDFTFRKGTTYTGAGSPGGGLLGCITGHNSVQDLSQCTTAYQMSGANLPAINTTGAVEQVLGTGYTYKSFASATFTNGDTICTDSSHLGYVLDGGTAPCSCPSVQAGVVELTNTAATHVGTVQPRGCVPTVASSATKLMSGINVATGAAEQVTISGDATINNGAVAVVKVNGSTPGGTCTNQAVTALSSSAVPTCTTLNASYADNTVAKTGTDINTSQQVTVTHLAAALPVNQGGTGTTTALAIQSVIYTQTQQATMTVGTGTITSLSPGTGCSVGVCTVVASVSGTHHYMFSVDMNGVTAGSSGTCSTGSVTIQLSFTDPDGNVAVAGSNNVPVISSNGATVSTSLTITSALSSSTVVRGLPFFFAAKTGTAITYLLNQSSTSNCSTPPVVQLHPLLIDMGY